MTGMKQHLAERVIKAMVPKVDRDASSTPTKSPASRFPSIPRASRRLSSGTGLTGPSSGARFEY